MDGRAHHLATQCTHPIVMGMPVRTRHYLILWLLGRLVTVPAYCHNRPKNAEQCISANHDLICPYNAQVQGS